MLSLLTCNILNINSQLDARPRRGVRMRRGGPHSDATCLGIFAPASIFKSLSSILLDFALFLTMTWLKQKHCPYCITHRTNTRLHAVRGTSAAEPASSTSLSFLSNAILSQETIEVGRCPRICSIIHYLSPPLPLLIIILHVRCCSGEYFWCGNRHIARPATVQRELSQKDRCKPGGLCQASW